MKLRTETLKIGAFVHERLSPLLPIYPISADKGVDLPFAVYRRTSLSPKDTKDVYNYEERVGIEVIVAARTYNDSVRLAQAVKDSLEGFKGLWGKALLTDINLETASEDWLNDAYVQRLQFTIVVDTYYV